MLRHCITLLRQIGCASFLPLDQHVYLHKVCGVVVAVLSAIHTMMHCVNFRKRDFKDFRFVFILTYNLFFVHTSA